MNAPTSLADGRYLLVKPLGEGGMATVYRAFDQRLQVWRAVKVLSPQYASNPRLMSRFEAEAQTMALLEHRHIVRVYDVGRDGNIAYIVMELVEGGALVDWLERNGPMPPRLAVQCAIELCRGIAFAHAKGVVHRDIKPHNVLVTTDGVCRVTDFGIARVGENDMSLTKTGAVMGTWGFMAPEQRSNAKTVDARADVYAIAATLYTLLTNELPMDLFAADRDPSMMVGIDPSLAKVMIRATDYNRDKRPANVDELAAELQAVLAELPAIPDGTAPLAQDPGDPPPIPRPEDYVRLRGVDTGNGGYVPGGTVVPTDGGEAPTRGTIVNDDRGMFAPTSAPDEGPLIDGGPQQDRPLYAPSSPEGRSGAAKAGIVVGWLLALGLGGLGVLLIGVAAVIFLNAGGGDAEATTAVTDPPPVVTEPATTPEPPKEPVADPAKASDPEPAKASAKASEPSPAKASTKTASTKGSTKASSSTKPPPASTETKGTSEPATTAASGTSEPAKAETAETKTVVVVAPQQCVKLTPPASPSVGADAVFKATLCTDDGTEVTLWFRPVGGTWQSRLMPKALGAHTAKVRLDEAYASGLEYYVVAGSISEGSQTAPMRLPVR